MNKKWRQANLRKTHRDLKSDSILAKGGRAVSISLKPAHLGYFSDRHIGPRDRDVTVMLDTVGYRSLDNLTQAVLPDDIYLKRGLDLGLALTEKQALDRLSDISARNVACKSWIGLGYHNCITPSVIKRLILENPGWYTQYTPYQAEISQGRLESLFNFQTLISDLTALPIANASLLDEATAAAEAASLSFHQKKDKNAKRCFISNLCHPQVVSVVAARMRAIGVEVVIGHHETIALDSSFFAAIVSYPCTNGSIFEYREFIASAHRVEALVTMCCDLLSLTLLEPPGELGVDIAVGNSQRFGVPLFFGGPHAAFFATREEFKRRVPGRIVGRSMDCHQAAAFRLSLQTREQHIRRKRATSNICTSQALLANVAAMYAVFHGPTGLASIAKKVHLLAVAFAKGLEKSPVVLQPLPFFDTVCVEVGQSKAKGLLERLRQRQINIREIDSETVSVTFDETTEWSDVEALWETFCEARPNLKEDTVDSPILTGQHLRTSPYLEHENFHKFRSETELMRYIKKLENFDISLTRGMIPLGSCTMKLNGASELQGVLWQKNSDIHPFVPLDQVAGHLQIIGEMESMLATLTGFDAVSLQPNSGAQGEYAGLCVIKAYHRACQQHQRDVCLIPTSAHGTNPASAVMAGFNVVDVACDSLGNVSLQDLKEKLDQNKEKVAAIMITYPSTHGIFEKHITSVCQCVHEYGGQVYMDGANLNAQLGLCCPGEFGADICHINLHKTFAIPHGGGGPGLGPIAVKAHLAEFLPTHPLVKTGGSQGIDAVSATPWGSAGILSISWMYIKMMGASGLKKATQIAILSANYIATKLSGAYVILYRGKKDLVAHEVIIDLRQFRQSCGIEVTDIAKRLIDFGFHAPTVAFPVPGTMMIEPTESESLGEIDRFCDAMLTIREEISSIEVGDWPRDDNPLKSSPHTASEVMASSWLRPYSRIQAVFPGKTDEKSKFWPPVGRVNEAYGDRNLQCRWPVAPLK